MTAWLLPLLGGAVTALLALYLALPLKGQRIFLYIVPMLAVLPLLLSSVVMDTAAHTPGAGVAERAPPQIAIMRLAEKPVMAIERSGGRDPSAYAAMAELNMRLDAAGLDALGRARKFMQQAVDAAKRADDPRKDIYTERLQQIMQQEKARGGQKGH